MRDRLSLRGDRSRTGQALALCIAGLATLFCTPAHAARNDSPGAVFYLDGSGGGGLLLNWSSGISNGLRQAGFRGDFREESWQTGLGPGADQLATGSFKRHKAERIAGEIRNYIDRHPGQPVHLIALSAGTAVAVFTLEALPAKYQVDNVVLLSASISSHYDLTNALGHVRGRVYNFTSRTDAVLDILVPFTGTADRRLGLCAGVRGCQLPGDAGADARDLYAKVENIDWRPEFARSGNFGTHTGPAHTAFIRDHVAPLLLKSAAANPPPAEPPSRRLAGIPISSQPANRWQSENRR